MFRILMWQKLENSIYNSIRDTWYSTVPVSTKFILNGCILFVHDLQILNRVTDSNLNSETQFSNGYSIKLYCPQFQSPVLFSLPTQYWIHLRPLLHRYRSLYRKYTLSIKPVFHMSAEKIPGKQKWWYHSLQDRRT